MFRKDPPREEGPGLATIVIPPLSGPPTKWKEVGKVSKLYVHPVKSMRGISLSNAWADRFGLRHGLYRDRQFVVVNPHGRTATAREFPKLVLVKPKIIEASGRGEHDTLILKAKGTKSLKVPLRKDGGDWKNIKVFGSSCSGIDLGRDASAWLSLFLKNEEGHNFRLLYHRDSVSSRDRLRENPLGLAPGVKRDDVSLYADTFGFMLLSHSSIEDLERRVGERGVSMKLVNRRFRPNILVKGTQPYEEDRWRYLRIGEAEFRVVGLCDRCTFTAVDPDKGVKDTCMEPFATLKRYRFARDPQERRQIFDKPLFGIKLGIDKLGEIKKGDKIFAGS